MSIQFWLAYKSDAHTHGDVPIMYLSLISLASGAQLSSKIPEYYF